MSDKPKLVFPADWRPSTLKEILHRQYEPPPWVITDLLPKQAGLLCSSLPHGCKSLSWLAAGIESVFKQTVWGKFDASPVRRMLYIETEDPRWLVEDRVRGLAQGFGITTHDLEDLGFGLACTGPFSLKHSQQHLTNLIDDFEPDWVVLSTLQGLIQGLDWNEQKDMSDVNAAVVRLQRHVPIVVITHSPRGGQRRSAGTITQDANYLTLMHFEKRTTNHKTVISVEGDSKMGAELEFSLRLDVAEINDHGRDRTQVRAVTYEYEDRSKTERIMDAMAKHPGADTKAIALLCDCSERLVRDVIKKVKERGQQIVQFS